MMQFLVCYEDNVKLKDKNGTTVLHILMSCPLIEMIKILLNNDTDVNEQMVDNIMPLM